MITFTYGGTTITTPDSLFGEALDYQRPSILAKDDDNLGYRYHDPEWGTTVEDRFQVRIPKCHVTEDDPGVFYSPYDTYEMLMDFLSTNNGKPIVVVKDEPEDYQSMTGYVSVLNTVEQNKHWLVDLSVAEVS